MGMQPPRVHVLESQVELTEGLQRRSQYMMLSRTLHTQLTINVIMPEHFNKVAARTQKPNILRAQICTRLQSSTWTHSSNKEAHMHLSEINFCF